MRVATMTSRADNGRGKRVGWSYFLPFPLAGGAKTAGGGVEACSSLPLCLPRPLPLIMAIKRASGSVDSGAQTDKRSLHDDLMNFDAYSGHLRNVRDKMYEVSPDLLVRVLVELVANYWSWPGGGGTTPQPQN